MDKKILMINASARKKNTYGLLCQIEKLLKPLKVKVEIINLFEYQLKDCIGCDICVTQKECPIPDDLKTLKQKILESDAIIFGTPIYLNGVNSKLKTFIDRTNAWVHKPATAGKPVMMVATSSISGIKDVKIFYRNFALNLGMRIGDFVARKSKNIKKPIKRREIKKFSKLLMGDKALYRPSFKEITVFNAFKVMANKSIGDDKLFWREKNWLRKPYYYPCKMGVLKKMYSKFMFKTLTKRIK